MKKSIRFYLAAGLTGFCAISASIAFFFLLFQAPVVGRFFSTVAHILRPIFMGMVLAFLLLPIYNWLLRILSAAIPAAGRGSRAAAWLINGLSLLLSHLFAFLLIYLLLAMVLPQVYDSVVGLINSIPSYIASVQSWLQSFLEDNPDIQSAVMSLYTSAASSFESWLYTDILPNLQSVTTSLKWLRESLLPNITGVVTNVSTVLIALLVLLKDLLIAVIVSVYLLARKDIFAAQSKKIVYSLLPTRAADFVVEETRGAYRILGGFINGKLLDSLIIGIIALIGCNLFRFPYPALIAAIIGVTNVIPFFGPFIGAIPSALIILLVSPIQCVYFCIFVLVLQQFDGNILGPKILGDSTGLASFWVLFSILLFGGLFGFAGMVLGVPVFAMFYNAVRRLTVLGLRRRGLPVNTADYLGRTGPFAPAAGEKTPSASKEARKTDP